MRLYHYVEKGNTVMQDGLLSFAKNPSANINYYIQRSGQNTFEGIVNWMEKCFIGRSRGIRCFTEPIQWHEQSLSLKKFIENADLFSFDPLELAQDDLLESVYCSPSVMGNETLQKNGCDEILEPIQLSQIDFSPIDWSICNDAKGWRFAFIRYYLLILKDGIIPPQYLRLENI